MLRTNAIDWQSKYYIAKEKKETKRDTDWLCPKGNKLGGTYVDYYCTQ